MNPRRCGDAGNGSDDAVGGPGDAGNGADDAVRGPGAVGGL